MKSRDQTSVLLSVVEFVIYCVLKALFIFITEKAESLHTIPPTGSFLIQESAGWFFVTTRGLTSFFFSWMVGKASAKRAENRIWREESCLALGAT